MNNTITPTTLESSIKKLQQYNVDNGLSKNRAPQLSTTENNERHDSLTVSKELQTLLNSGIRPQRSQAAFSDGNIQFELQFASATSERISATGYYSEERREANISLSFTFSQLTDNNGQETTRRFEATLEITATNVESFSIEQFEQKEDIVGFVRRVVQDILDISADEDKVLNGVIFDTEDLQELASLQDGEISKIVAAIVSMATFLGTMKRITQKSDEERPESVTLYPERVKQTGILETQETASTFETRLSIREITTSPPSKPTNAETNES